MSIPHLRFGPPGMRPRDAVLVAYNFHNHYLASLQTCKAEPHADVKDDHIRYYGRVGLRVFQPEPRVDTRASLSDCVTAHMQTITFNPNYKIDIQVKSVPAIIRESGEKVEASRALRSLIFAVHNQALIRIVDEITDCWKRFVCAKELAHLIMGPRGKPTNDPHDQLLQAFKIGDPAVSWDAEVSREVFAWIMAIELVLPYWDRKILHRMIDDKVEAMLIAQHYRIPKAVIDMYAESDYKNRSSEILSSITI